MPRISCGEPTSFMEQGTNFSYTSKNNKVEYLMLE